jgi:Protein of unknown function (DUF2490)
MCADTHESHVAARAEVSMDATCLQIRMRRRPRYISNALGLSVLVVILASPVTAQPQSTTQEWPEIDMYYRVNSKVRLSFFASATRENREGTDAEIGPNIDFYLKPLRNPKRFVIFQLDESRSRMLTFRAGYRYLPSISSPTEQRGILEATGRYPVAWSVLLSDRNRVDLRFIAGEFSWRYRNRLSAEREFQIKSYHFAPYVRGEVYYDSRYGKFSRTAETIGCPFPIHKRLEIEPYYEHQNDTSDAPNSQVNASGLVLSLYFHHLN